MQGMFNADITIQSIVVGEDDEDGNKTYTYVDILTDERSRAYEFMAHKLDDDKNWITYRARKFIIKDISADLTLAAYVVYDGKYYKIEKIIKPGRFSRIKHRVIETVYKEGKA